MGKALRWRYRGLIAAAFVMSLSRSAGARELKVLCIPGLKAAIDAVIPDFERVFGQKVDLTYEIYAGQKQRIEAGNFDVAIFTKSQIAEMVEQHQVVPGSSADVATTSISLELPRRTARMHRIFQTGRFA